MPSSSDVQEFRSHLVTLTGLAVDDLEAEWGGWSWDDAESLTAAALVAVPDVTWTWQDTAGGVAADAYDMWRDAERVPGRFLASPASLAEEDQILAGIRNAVGPLWSATPDEAAAKSLLTGMATRLVLHGASDTIVGATSRDPRAAGWYRVARAGACRFCRMLSGRGAVYRSEKSARFAAHDHCHCAAVPSWDQDAPEVEAIAYVASQRKQTAADRARVRAFLDSM